MFKHEQSTVTVLPVTINTLSSATSRESVRNALLTHRIMLDEALRCFVHEADILAEVAALLVETLRSGHKVLVAGNGGSAAEAQHFAAELVGRFKRERAPYAVLSLTTDTSILTAVGNDYGYHEVFARQVRAFGKSGDMLIAFSTSGESENLLCAAQAAQACHMHIVAVTGERLSRLAALADKTVRTPTSDTAIAQELHMMVTHILCDIVETQLSDALPVATGEGEQQQ